MIKSKFFYILLVLLIVSCSKGNAQIAFESCSIAIPEQFKKVTYGFSIEEYVLHQNSRIANITLQIKEDDFDSKLKSKDFAILTTLYQGDLKITVFNFLIPSLDQKVSSISIENRTKQLITNGLTRNEIDLVLSDCVEQANLQKIILSMDVKVGGEN